MSSEATTGYLDYNATTPLAPEVLEAMLPYLGEQFGNPSSLHARGRRGREALFGAREALASFLKAAPTEVAFTSGGTESDNLAVLGLLAGAEASGDDRRHLICSRIEHHAVLRVMQHLAQRGYQVSFLEVDRNGRVCLEALREAIRSDTLLVSIMYANNETGVVQPVEQMAPMVRELGAYFHTDAVQAFGKIPVDVPRLGVDLLSLSAHKFYGPKGVGALYVREGTPFEPLVRGGGQERGLRPGTENIAGIVGLAEAARQVERQLAADIERLEGLREWLQGRVLERVPAGGVNGLEAPRTPNTVSFRFEGADGGRLVQVLDDSGFAVSAGAACTAGALEPSHVLAAMGLSLEEAQGSIRVSLGRYTKQSEVRAFADTLERAVPVVREGQVEKGPFGPVRGVAP